MGKETDSVREHLEAALLVARESLGPASATLLGLPESQAVLLSRLRAGLALEDAVLGVVHEAAHTDRDLANEFLAYFLEDLMCAGHGALGGGLRRFLDTGDLVDSVVGDVWPQLRDIQFETRASFISLLAKRIQWKASDRARALGTSKRREDRRVEVEPGDLVAESEPGASSIAGRQDESDWLVLQILKLPPRDRTILRLHLGGASPRVIADKLGILLEAAQRATHRALERAREAGLKSRSRRHL